MKKNYKLSMWLLVAVLMFTANVSWGQVFITELADPNNEAGARYIELYNAGSSSVDLTGWVIQRYSNGNATPTSGSKDNLTGSIAAKGFYIIANNPTIYKTTFKKTADFDGQDTGASGSNGDDQVELLNVAGTSVDIFGVPGEDGSNTCHEFEDGRAERKSTVTTGNNGTWNEANWNVWSDGSTASGCTSHTSNSPQDAPGGNFDPGAWIGAAAASPTVTLTPTSLTGFSTASGIASASQNFAVSGSTLTGDLTVTAPAGFEVSLDNAAFAGTQTLAVSGGTVTGQPKTVHVRVTASATAGAKSEKVTISGGGLAANGEVTVSGTVAAAGTAVVTNTGTLTAATTGEGTASASQSITVSGINLTADITATAPAGFEVSLDNTTFSNSVALTQTGGNVSSVTVYIRVVANAAAGTPAGNVALTSTGATQVDVAVSATVVALSTIKSLREAVDANGEPTVTGTKAIKGVVYGVNFSGQDISFTVVEGTNGAKEGINAHIRSSEFAGLGIASKDAFVAGDELVITGTVSSYNGLMQIGSVTSITKTGTGTVQAEAVLTALSEDSESRLIKLENVIVTDPTEWKGESTNTRSFNVNISVGGVAFTMRIDGDTELAKKTYAEVFTGSATSGLTIVGLGGQFDNSDPRDSGYQILPWKTANITIDASKAVPNAPATNAPADITVSGFTAKWTAAATGEATVSYELDVATDDTFTVLIVGFNALSLTETSKAVTGLSAGTRYYVRVRAVGANGTSLSSNVAFVTTSGTTTGVNPATDVTFSTHPNPTQGTLVIESNAHKFAKVVVTSFSAKTMITKSLQGAQRSTIDLSNLSQGVYLVQIFDGKGNVLSVRRIVKR